MASSIDGLVSGLNTTQIISQLMQVERQPEQAMQAQQAQDQTRIGIYQQLNSLLSSLAGATGPFIPDTITGQSNWQATTAAVSDPTIASATSDGTATAGSVSFRVTSLAAAGAAVSSGTVSATSAGVGTGPILLARGAAAIGFSDLSAGASLTAGSHTIRVTQASAAAGFTGVAVAPSVTLDGSNNQLSVYLDGAAPPTTYTIAAGTYTQTQLAQAITTATGGQLTATVAANGALTLSTVEEGSAATVQLAAANSALGLTDLATVWHGTDAVVTVDGQSQTVSSLTPGRQIILSGANGDSISGTLAGGLRAGAATATSVTVSANDTLTAVVKAINASSAGVGAAAVQVGTGAYRLQLTSTTTGADTDITLNNGAFGGGLGTLQQLTAGSDTVLHVGSGAGAYDVRSSTAQVTGWLTGVTVNAVRADPTSTTTLTIASDGTGIAAKLKSLVDGANGLVNYVGRNSQYDTTNKSAGPLLGDSLANNLLQRIWGAAIGTAATTPSAYGISVQKDGTLAFDQSTFLTQWQKDPAGAQAVLTSMSQSMSSVATRASDPISGTVTQQIKSYEDDTKTVAKEITDFEDRMTLKQQSLQTEFAKLETALGQMQSQSSWLTGQLAALSANTTASGSK